MKFVLDNHPLTGVSKPVLFSKAGLLVYCPIASLTCNRNSKKTVPFERKNRESGQYQPDTGIGIKDFKRELFLEKNKRLRD